MRVLFATLIAASPALADPAIPFFVDATAVASLSHSYSGNEDYVVGGGAAAFDCNGDGMPDLALAGAEAPLTLYINTGRAGRPPEFEVASLPQIKESTGVYPLDLTGDGHLDLFVLRFGRNLLLEGQGDCRFVDATDRLGLPDRLDWTTAFAAHWEGDADLPTLFVGNYVPRDRPLQESGNCEPSYLLRPEGDAYGAPIELGEGACTLSALFVDWSGSGVPDLRLANDREYYNRGMSEQLWQLTSEGAVQYGRADGWDDISLWGMGISAQDITGDGRPEMAVTSMADNRLERLRTPDADQPRFDDIARSAGATAQRPAVGPDARPSTSWHTEFGDANNDGLVDLLIIKGNVDQMPRFANFDPDSLLLNTGDGFVEAGYASGIAVDTRGRGAVFQDLNGDGALDILTVNRNQPVRLFMGRPMAGFVSVDLRQQGGNAFAVGATVELHAGDLSASRTRSVGGGHAGGALLPLHFGLGSEPRAELRARWPDGTFSPWQKVTAGQAVTLTRE